jgi:hypothetical protein
VVVVNTMAAQATGPTSRRRAAPLFVFFFMLSPIDQMSCPRHDQTPLYLSGPPTVYDEVRQSRDRQ